MTEEEDRRGPPPSRRLSDNQILQNFADGNRAQSAIARDIDDHRELIGELRDELTSFRCETRDQLKSVNDNLARSRLDRDTIRTEIAGIGDCIGDLKTWQYRADQQAKADREERDQRQTHQDVVYSEIVDEFKFRRKLGKWRNSILVTTGMMLGLIISGHSLWEMIKHLFKHPQP